MDVWAVSGLELSGMSARAPIWVTVTPHILKSQVYTFLLGTQRGVNGQVTGQAYVQLSDNGHSHPHTESSHCPTSTSTLSTAWKLLWRVSMWCHTVVMGHLVASSVVCPLKSSTQCPAELSLALLLLVCCSLYILEMTSLMNFWIANVFSHSVTYIFVLQRYYLEKQNLTDFLTESYSILQIVKFNITFKVNNFWS